jgi:hypothetical protein
MDMKTFKAGNIEVMSHDYYRGNGVKGQMHVTWKDYELMNYDPFLKQLKAEEWRVPSAKEAFYLRELHNMGLGGFSDQWPPYSNYFIEPTEKAFPSGYKPRVLNFYKGKIETHMGREGLALLRLVRTI